MSVFVSGRLPDISPDSGQKICHVTIGDYYHTIQRLYYYNGTELVQVNATSALYPFEFDMPAGILVTDTEYKSSPLNVSSGEITRFFALDGSYAGFYVYGNGVIGNINN